MRRDLGVADPPGGAPGDPPGGGGEIYCGAGGGPNSPHLDAISHDLFKNVSISTHYVMIRSKIYRSRRITS